MTNTFHSPVWDRGDPIDAEMMRFTIGDDWLMDQRLVAVDIQGSLAHAAGLAHVGLIEEADHAAIRGGLETLLTAHQAGEWTVEPGDEDVHSAVERRLVELVGDAGKRLHTGRSRNDQVAVDMRLWLRGSTNEAANNLVVLMKACERLIERAGNLSLPGYTHLRRAMPSSVADWLGAHLAAFADDLEEFDSVRRRTRACPLGSGAGYGIPLELDRAFVARQLGFEAPEMPVTLTQHQRGRAELAYLNALDAIALDLGKLAFDLWLFTSEEFGFVRLPVELTTGSSLMPHKRNPDLVELLRAHCRQVAVDRDALAAVVRDLPSGYHRDFQLAKPPLFRAHDRMAGALPLMARLLDGLQFDEERLAEAADDPGLEVTRRALERAKAGEPFRDAYRAESARS